jgi:chaperone required for assembly of F1-ATPase
MSDLSKRFYARVDIAREKDGFHLKLDGKMLRTPARAQLILPNEALALALTQEWEAQREIIEPSTMPLTRLANVAIDGVATQREEVLSDLLRYVRSDLIFYRAEAPEALVKAQEQAWDPVLAWALDQFGARFISTQGVMFVEQSEEAIEKLTQAFRGYASPFSLAALHVMTTLTGSVLITLKHATGKISSEQAWDAAHVDERHQESLWGEDDEAIERRNLRRFEFMAASRMMVLTEPACVMP